jgi:hypothetical protein
MKEMTDLFKKTFTPRLAGSGTRKIRVEQGTEVASTRLIDPLNRAQLSGLNLSKIAIRPNCLDILSKPSRMGGVLRYPNEEE